MRKKGKLLVRSKAKKTGRLTSKSKSQLVCICGVRVVSLHCKERTQTTPNVSRHTVYPSLCYLLSSKPKVASKVSKLSPSANSRKCTLSPPSLFLFVDLFLSVTPSSPSADDLLRFQETKHGNRTEGIRNSLLDNICY